MDSSENMERWAKRDKEKKDKIDRLVGILDSHGIYMSVGGCGCCGSPGVKFVYNGETIIDDDDVNF